MISDKRVEIGMRVLYEYYTWTGTITDLRLGPINTVVAYVEFDDGNVLECPIALLSSLPGENDGRDRVK